MKDLKRMERKIGEIFEYNGEWYQCIHTKSLGCENCDLATKSDIHCSDVFEIRGECLSCYRKDGKSVIFKKLKKVGEPEIINGKKVQSIVTGYVGCAFCIFKKGGACLSGGTCKNRGTGTIYAEVKQNKENMEESAELKLFADRTSNVNEVYMEKRLCNRLKPFNLEAAKAGKPVYTRDGRKARIICFDYKGDSNAYPILALISTINLRGVPSEIIAKYTEDGRYAKYNNVENNEDLMILPEKKEGWVNIYNRNRPRTSSENCYIITGVSVFETKEGAISYIDKDKEYIDTVKIEWEE